MRVVAKGLNPDRTRVSAIMTPNPDTVPPEMTAVEALGEASIGVARVPGPYKYKCRGHVCTDRRCCRERG